MVVYEHTYGAATGGRSQPHIPYLTYPRPRLYIAEAQLLRYTLHRVHAS